MPRRAHALFAVAVLSLAMPCLAQAPGGAKDAGECQRVLCREPASVRVVLKDGTARDVASRAANPIVLANGSVTIRQAEQVNIAVDLQGDAVRGVRAVKLPTEASDALSMRLTQDATTRDSLLVVENGADRMLKFDLALMAPDSDRLVKTASCPVGPGKSLYEQFTQPVYQVVITRIRVLAAGSPATCN